MNKIEIVGNIVRDPEIKYTNGGKAVAKFTIASDRGRGENAGTDYFECEAWEALGESVNTDRKAGEFVRVRGSVRLGSYETENGKRKTTTVVVRSIALAATTKERAA